VKLQLLLVYCILFFECKLHSQTSIFIPLNNENIEIQTFSSPLPNGYYPKLQKNSTKPLTANCFVNNAFCPLLSSNVLIASGNHLNTFFGGDRPYGHGFGFVPSLVTLDSVLNSESFPITLTCDFFARNREADFNEFYFWLGNYNHIFFNPSNSVLPSANAQEGLIIGGTPEITLINNSRTPFLSSERLFTLNQNITQYNQWTTLKVTIDLNCNNEYIVEKLDLNGVDLLQSPLNLGQLPSINRDSLQIGFCVDDLAKIFPSYFTLRTLLF
jgi:hypothetical protein